MSQRDGNIFSEDIRGYSLLICPSVAMNFADNAATTVVGLAGATWIMNSYLKEMGEHTAFWR